MRGFKEITYQLLGLVLIVLFRALVFLLMKINVLKWIRKVKRKKSFVRKINFNQIYVNPNEISTIKTKQTVIQKKKKKEKQTKQ